MYVGIVFILGYMLTQSMCKVQCTEQTLSKEFSYRLVKICWRAQFRISLWCEACIGKRSCHFLETLAWICTVHTFFLSKGTASAAYIFVSTLLNYASSAYPQISLCLLGLNPGLLRCSHWQSELLMLALGIITHKTARSHPLSELHNYLTRFPTFILCLCPFLCTVFVIYLSVIDACFATGVW